MRGFAACLAVVGMLFPHRPKQPKYSTEISLQLADDAFETMSCVNWWRQQGVNPRSGVQYSQSWLTFAADSLGLCCRWILSHIVFQFLFELVPRWDKHRGDRMKLILTNLNAWYCILLLITKWAYFQFKFLFQVTYNIKKKKRKKFLLLLSPYLHQTHTMTAAVLSSLNLAPVRTTLNVQLCLLFLQGIRETE